MPELPEVETIKRQLNSEVAGFKIEEITYDTSKMLRPNPESFIRGVQSKIIKSVDRRAKFLIFNLEEGGFFTVHLRLSGRLLVRKPEEPEDDFVHVVLQLKIKNSKCKVATQNSKLNKCEKLELRFAEARKFGYMRYLESHKELESVLAEYGPEPLDGLTEEKFYQILSSTGRKIKQVLMDQKTIAGIGNIYANDALWVAKIHPETGANRLSRSDSEELFKAINNVMQEALRLGGSSDQWYRQIHGEEGEYQQYFKIYSRAGEKCSRCGEVVKYKKLGGRGTFWCPKCQKKNEN